LRACAASASTGCWSLGAATSSTWCGSMRSITTSTGRTARSSSGRHSRGLWGDAPIDVKRRGRGSCVGETA
jgi:hypothetical protein